MQINFENLARAIQREPWAAEISANVEQWELVMEWVEENVLSDFLYQVTHQIDELVEINPDFTEPEILEIATQYVVEFLDAHSGSVRIYDPRSGQMLSYGSYPSRERTRRTFVPLEGSIAGEVVRSRKACLVPNIAGEARYMDKDDIRRRGIHSLMAIPLELTRFFPGERDTVGVIQIYFSERNRVFRPLEVQLAKLMSKRLGFVIARKRIHVLQRNNEKREAIVGHIFRTLGDRSGIKMKEVFDRVIPELADMVNLQSCALFSVSEDFRTAVLEAGYPETGGYHSIGKRFSVDTEPAFSLALGLETYTGDGAYEVVTPSYILVMDPQKSPLISPNLKAMARYHSINSILYVPLSVSGEVTHFMTFDALEQRTRYGEEEISLFLFLGRELMKAQKMERLDDALHDFKNPAIATAGFARRLKRLLEGEQNGENRKQILHYADILLEETSRLQELALSIYQVGKEQVVDLTEVLRRRFEINREAIREQFKPNVILKAGPFADDLPVRCFVINLERVFDNLLNNATKAVPMMGGILGIQTYRDGKWACAEITNTGRISDEERQRFLEGKTSGRGLYITNRIVRLLNGRVDIRQDDDKTTFVVRVPLFEED